MGTGVVEQVSPRQFCSECGRDFPAQDLAHFGQAAICADCKPNYVQRMREGVPSAVRTALVFGGFWQRFAASFLDGIIMVVLFAILLGLAWASHLFNISEESAGFTGLVYLLVFGVPLAYEGYFLTQKGATPGKMAIGLKVVTANGDPISVGRAIGRYFARGLSGSILYIGYIMAAFDDENRALHDRLCDTRVVRG